jgi:hypothetical protein
MFDTSGSYATLLQCIRSFLTGKEQLYLEAPLSSWQPSLLKGNLQRQMF